MIQDTQMYIFRQTTHIDHIYKYKPTKSDIRIILARRKLFSLTFYGMLHSYCSLSFSFLLFLERVLIKYCISALKFNDLQHFAAKIMTTTPYLSIK